MSSKTLIVAHGDWDVIERKIIARTIGYESSNTFSKPTSFSWPCKCGWDFKGEELFELGIHELPCAGCSKTLQIEIVEVNVKRSLLSESFKDKMNRDYKAHNAYIESQNDHLV